MTDALHPVVHHERVGVSQHGPFIVPYPHAAPVPTKQRKRTLRTIEA